MYVWFQIPENWSDGRERYMAACAGPSPGGGGGLFRWGRPGQGRNARGRPAKLTYAETDAPPKTEAPDLTSETAAPVSDTSRRRGGKSGDLVRRPGAEIDTYKRSSRLLQSPRDDLQPTGHQFYDVCTRADKASHGEAAKPPFPLSRKQHAADTRRTQKNNSLAVSRLSHCFNWRAHGDSNPGPAD